MILVTGGSGFMGSRLLKKLVSQGHKVKAMVIKNDPYIKNIERVNCEIVEGDITNPETLTDHLEGIKTVFHLAAVMVSHDKKLFHRINYEGTKNVVNKCVETGVKHFIYISAAAADYKIRTDYGNTKMQAEGLMKKQGNTNFTIVRPTLLYGPDGGQEFSLYVKNISKFPLIVPMVGSGKTRKRLVFVDDVIDGLSKLVNKPVTYGKTYNFSGASDYSMWKITKLICKQLGIKKPMIPVPVFLCYFIALASKLILKEPLLNHNTILGVTMDANFSYEDAFKDIGYEPIALEEGLKKSFPDQKFYF